jgi:L-aspartate oxidase
VVPAAHYVCGGLAVDEWGRTSLPGLYATGECACTGLHGANRLASNSLLEALVFADRAAQHATRATGWEPVDTGKASAYPAATAREEQAATRLRRKLNDVMWQDTGIVRSDAGLTRAAESLRKLEDEAKPLTGRASVACLELRNLLTVARLIVTCARRRPESRGLHYNEDHPSTVEGFNHDTIIDAEDTGTRAS